MPQQNNTHGVTEVGKGWAIVTCYLEGIPHDWAQNSFNIASGFQWMDHSASVIKQANKQRQTNLFGMGGGEPFSYHNLTFHIRTILRLQETLRSK